MYYKLACSCLEKMSSVTKQCIKVKELFYKRLDTIEVKFYLVPPTTYINKFSTS